MKLIDMYNLAIEAGIESDPRGKEAIARLLDKEQKSYDKLADEDKGSFDMEKLTNPFADTRILNGDPETEIKSLIAGVDMETQEILLADRLREKGRSVDVIMAHHPEGKSLAALADVMGVQADIWHQFGVPINVGEAVLEGRQAEVMRSVSPLNHQRAVMAAKLLDFPFICVHTPCDNLVNRFLQQQIEEVGDDGTVEDLIKKIKEIPEYAESGRHNAGPKVFVGREGRRTGRVLVDMTGGTGGPSESLSKLAEAGVGTLVGMHMSEKNREEAEKNKLNVVIAGHDSSDSIGMNLFLDGLEKQGVDIIPCSGFIRVSRV